MSNGINVGIWRLGLLAFSIFSFIGIWMIPKIQMLGLFIAICSGWIIFELSLIFSLAYSISQFLARKEYEKQEANKQKPN